MSQVRTQRAGSNERWGMVVGSQRRHFRVRAPDGDWECVIRGRSLAVACGDRVRFGITGDRQGVIESVGDRSTLFYRADAFRSKLIAANVTQVVGVIAVEPAWSPELMDRWIVAAEANGCRFVVVLNKSDLPGIGAAGASAPLQTLRELGYPVVTLSARRDASPLVPLLAGQRSLLVGQSGMGKSTLINALIPGAQARVGEISRALGSGRHTTSATLLYPLTEASCDAWLIDSPGMHEFGLAHLSRGQIEVGFREMRALSGHCRFRDCSHSHEPDCAAIAAVERGQFDRRRLASLVRVLAEHATLRRW